MALMGPAYCQACPGHHRFPPSAVFLAYSTLFLFHSFISLRLVILRLCCQSIQSLRHFSQAVSICSSSSSLPPPPIPCLLHATANSGISAEARQKDPLFVRYPNSSFSE